MPLPPDDSLIGRMIAGKFCLQSCIGVGASGTVYRAGQKSLGRTVAVKVLRPELAALPRFVRRFNAEALAASRLNHPNVVSIIDFGQTSDGLLYLVMEFLRGSTLAAIASNGSLPPAHIPDLVKQILSALEEAHACGVIHADLKTDNIMIERRRGGWDLVKVLDFGIARLTGQEYREEEGTICGTPEYMAPEVIRGNEPGVTADIYAVGVLMYELLVGFTPFSGAGAMEVLTRHLEEAPVPPSARRLDISVPPRLEEAIMRSLAKDPAKRFQSAHELAAFLQEESSPAQQILCTTCGATCAVPFKYCPECGASAQAQQHELAHEDIGATSEESGGAWADEFPTADLPTSEMRFLHHDEQDAPTTPPVEPQLDTGVLPLPMLGYEKERAELTAFLQSKTGGSLELLASSGSGKSVLVREVCEAVVATDSTLVFLTGADPTGLRAPFFPIRAVIAAVLNLPPVASYDDISQSLVALNLTKRDLPGIAELFQDQTGGLWQLEASVRRREVFAAVLRILHAVGAQLSAIVVFEDHHLYDQPSLDLLEELVAQNFDATHLKIVLSAEPEATVSWPGLQKLALGPLGKEDLAPLFAHFEHHSQAHFADLAKIGELAKGHPGHLQHLVRFIIEGGDLSHPPSQLADLVAARLDVLPTVAKRILQAIAIFGNEVSPMDLAAVLSASIRPAEVQTSLKLLSARGLVVCQPDLVRFTSTMVRDVTYESTPVDVRRTLHEMAGEILSATMNDPAVLGWHAERAGDLPRAAELLMRAGDNAIHQLDDVGATGIFSRALRAARMTLLGEETPQARLRLMVIAIKLADALRISGELGLAHGVLEEAREYCSEAPSLRAQLLRAEAQLHGTIGDVDRAISLYKEAIGLMIPLFAIDVLTETYLDLSTMNLRKGDRDGAIAELQEGVDLVTAGQGVEADKTPKHLWQLLLRLAQLYNITERSEDALHVAHQALRAAGRSRSSVGPARARATIAAILDSLGDEPRAKSYRERAIRDMRELGDRRATAELLLAASQPSDGITRITPTSIREARLLAQEVGWREGMHLAREPAK